MFEKHGISAGFGRFFALALFTLSFLFWPFLLLVFLVFVFFLDFFLMLFHKSNVYALLLVSVVFGFLDSVMCYLLD